MIRERRHNIIIVDEDTGFLETVGEVIARDGHSVFLAGSAAVALELLRSHPASALVASLSLPGTKGDVLLARAGREQRGIVRLLRADHEDAQVVIRCLREGSIDAFFPRSGPVAGLAGLLNELLSAQSEKAPPASSSRVLVIEDSSLFRALAEKLLGGRYRILTAENGIQGLLKAMVEAPDLVITGLRLGGVSGTDVIGFLRKGLKMTCPVIVWEFPSLLEEIPVEGAAIVVPKTAGHPAELLEAVERFLPSHPPLKPERRGSRR